MECWCVNGPYASDRPWGVDPIPAAVTWTVASRIERSTMAAARRAVDASMTLMPCGNLVKRGSLMVVRRIRPGLVLF